MKKLLPTLVFLFLVSVQLQAQRFREAVLWEIITTNGGLIVGASLDEVTADRAIKSFSKRNKGQKYQAYLSNKKYTTFVVRKSKGILDDLKSYTAKGYIIVSPKELEVLEDNKGKSLNKIAASYARASRISFKKAMREVMLIQKYQIGKRITSNKNRVVSN